MTRPSDLGDPALGPANSPGGAGSRPGTPVSYVPSPRSRWGLLAAASLLVYLFHPLTWTAAPFVPPTAAWSPQVGLGFLLFAWFGRRSGAIVLGGTAALLFVQHAALGTPVRELAWVLADALLVLGEVSLAWWLFHDRAGGQRTLRDPTSSILFVLLVPGVAAGATAVVRVLLLTLLGLAGPRLGLQLATAWLDQALGVLVVAPPLLVCLSPWLLSQGLIRQDYPPSPARRRWAAPATRDDPWLASTAPAGTRVVGDWIETLGLAACAGIVSYILSRLHSNEVMGWQLWGVQTLLIVWASVRQGLRGGTLVASMAAVVPLISRQFAVAGETPLFLALLMAHLAAQCSAALLVAAAASWVRMQESGYRQVVAHVPVVIYSARLPRGPAAVSPSQLLKDDAAPRKPAVAEVTLVSAASTQVLGCPPEQLLGDYRHWLDCVHPDDQVILLASIDQLARQDAPVTCEYRLAPQAVREETAARVESLPDGEPWPIVRPQAAQPVRWLRDTLAPHRDGEGQLVGWDGVVTDITEQRLLADDLRRTTSMFHALVTNLPAGVFFVQGPHGTPILVNARARQLLGAREDYSAGLDHLPRLYRLFRADGTLYPAEELPVYLALRHGRTTMKDDIVVHRPDGRKLPLISWAAPVVLGTSATPCAVWVIEDLTTLHQAEAARKDSDRRLRTIIETMAEGLFVHDAKGTIQQGNPAVQGFFSVPGEQCRGKTVHEIGWTYLKEDGTVLPQGDHPTEVVLRTGRPVRHVVLGIRRGEEVRSTPQAPVPLTRWLMVNAIPLGPAGVVGDGPAVPGGVVTTYSDIGAYLQAREAIRISEERYRGLIESLPLMLIQTDRNLRLIYANPATTVITGYSLEEIADPAAWASVVHVEDLAFVQERLRAALAGSHERGEFRYQAKDGTEKVVYAIWQPRVQEGRIVGLTVLLVDVTRERQLERELERSRRLELIGRLSSGVAHDFNNLLGVVLNLTDLARGHLPAEHPVHADLKRITEAGEQASALATQLLAFSKQRSQAARRVDLNLIVRRTLELLRATLPVHIKLEESLTPLETPILADETQVQQVLMNLCLNARDAMPHGGKLTVTTTLERESSAQGLPVGSAARQVVRLGVADTGQGMSEDVRGRIFEPFFSTKEGGTGLGLAVVQQIVESYGGRIEVASRPGHGAEFTIRWPFARG